MRAKNTFSMNYPECIKDHQNTNEKDRKGKSIMKNSLCAHCEHCDGIKYDGFMCNKNGYIENKSVRNGCESFEEDRFSAEDAKKKPEYHLYLYFPSAVVGTFSHSVKAVNLALSYRERHINTCQVCTIKTDLFTRGYRIFVHDMPGGFFEITLGNCARTNQEIRMDHNLEKMLLSGEFKLNGNPFGYMN